MLISYRARFIFVHVAKTGGSSIRRALQPYADPPVISRRKLQQSRLRFASEFTGLRPNQQKHLRGVAIRRILPEDIFSDFFKFAFVRNTWDQLISTYFFILHDPTHPLHCQVSSLAGFDDYVAWRTRTPSAPQKKFVADADGTLLVDFLGRFEHLAADFRTVCDRLQITAPLPHCNPSAHRDYRSYYSDRTAAIVEAAFREDIEYFGFSFDGGQRREAA